MVTDRATFIGILKSTLGGEPRTYSGLNTADRDHPLIVREDVRLILKVMQELEELGYQSPPLETCRMLMEGRMP